MNGLDKCRYRPATIRFIGFPELRGLRCPAGQPETLVLPVLVTNLWHRMVFRRDVGGSSGELLRESTLFIIGIFIIALEMVLARARAASTNSCEILVMWSLHGPLDQFSAFVWYWRTESPWRAWSRLLWQRACS